ERRQSERGIVGHESGETARRNLQRRRRPHRLCGIMMHLVGANRRLGEARAVRAQADQRFVAAGGGSRELDEAAHDEAHRGDPLTLAKEDGAGCMGFDLRFPRKTLKGRVVDAHEERKFSQWRRFRHVQALFLFFALGRRREPAKRTLQTLSFRPSRSEPHGRAAGSAQANVKAAVAKGDGSRPGRIFSRALQRGRIFALIYEIQPFKPRPRLSRKIACEPKRFMAGRGAATRKGAPARSSAMPRSMTAPTSSARSTKSLIVQR